MTILYLFCIDPVGWAIGGIRPLNVSFQQLGEPT